MSKETFKQFIKTKPELIDYVNDNTMTWQKFYELYDIYGEDETIWNRYQSKSSNKSSVTNLINKFDPDNIQKHIETAQKALDIFSEFTTKTSDKVTSEIKPNIERPISKFFGD